MSIISEVKGFIIQSEHYSEGKQFEVFPDKTSRVALLYGRNGSGKSTIARGFRKIKEQTTDVKIDIFNHDGGVLDNFKNSKESNVFIFDEDYIEKKVKVREEGLDTIVLIGDQVYVDEKIKEVKQEIKKLTKEKEKQDVIVEEVNMPQNPKSPLFYQNNCVRILKKRWANIDCEIKGNKANSSVRVEDVEKFSKIKDSKNNITELENELTAKLETYQNTSNATNIISEKISNISEPDILLEENIKELLLQTIEKPRLTEREESILSVFESKMAELSTIKDYLSDDNIEMCEKCLQPIKKSYRENTLEQIKKIVNKEYDDFIKKIEKYWITPIDVENYNQFKVIDEKQYNSIFVAISELNSVIKKHNEKIDNKLENPYNLIEYGCEIELSKCYESLNKELNLMESKRVTYNLAFGSRNDFKDELLELNRQIAKYEIMDDYNQFESRLKSQKDEMEILDGLNSELEKLETKLFELQLELKSTKIAMEEINNSLRYIFYSKDRLFLEVEADGLYHLKVNNQVVSPNRVSSGERNAIALSYFFTELADGTEHKSIYSLPQLLVIDDPISSFDFGNRIGIMSLIKLKMQKILLQNCDTKCLVMTHDTSVMFDLRNCFEEISKKCKSNGVHAKVSMYEINEVANLITFEPNNNEYNQAIKQVYSFATSSSQEDSTSVGNTMRRVLEGFATFSYRKGISDVSCDESILSIIPEDKRTYFEASMYRLVLNSESHFKENIQGNTEINWFNYLTMDEKSRTAKDIICFLYLLNSQHVLFQLEVKSNKKQEVKNTREQIEESIQSWIDDIFK
ncbi:AAA family ATPase [Enterococcus plantarum]|uniref:AAA family ATPase n=1 Tax=Enterococcus plantarum TaxID=1077675 RepID=UPI001A8CAA5A|nr:AAA family ATPase [Enterococcus plantarum]MBO0467485.1 AAA family ATPase [Enterococcus plantarum]